VSGPLARRLLRPLPQLRPLDGPLSWFWDSAQRVGRLNEIAVSDQATLEGLTQFLTQFFDGRPQIAEDKSIPGPQDLKERFALHCSKVARNSLILKRRDGGVVDRARLESEAGQPHQATSKSVNAHAISDLTFPNYHAVCVGKPRCSSRF